MALDNARQGTANALDRLEELVRSSRDKDN